MAAYCFSGLKKMLQSFIGSSFTCFSKSFHVSKALAAGKLCGCARIVPSLVRLGTQLNIPGLLAALVPVNVTMGEGAFGFYGLGFLMCLHASMHDCTPSFLSGKFSRIPKAFSCGDYCVASVLPVCSLLPRSSPHTRGGGNRCSIHKV